MAWRSAVIANDLAGYARYRLADPRPLVEWSSTHAPAATAALGAMLG